MNLDKNTIFRVSILEKDEEVIAAICNALNALANPDEHFGFKFAINESKFVISVSTTNRKNVIPDLEVAFKINYVAYCNFSTLNTFLKKSILFFEYDESQLIVSIVDKYVDDFEDVEFEQLPNVEQHSCMFPMQKSVSHVDQVVQVLNVIHIRKFLVLNRNNLIISALGNFLALTLKVTIYEQDSNNVHLFFSKFNVMSAQGLASYSFSIVFLSSQSPKMFQISVYTPQEPKVRAEFEKQMDLLDSISAFSQL